MRHVRQREVCRLYIRLDEQQFVDVCYPDFAKTRSRALQDLLPPPSLSLSPSLSHSLSPVLSLPFPLARSLARSFSLCGLKERGSGCPGVGWDSLRRLPNAEYLSLN